MEFILIPLALVMLGGYLFMRNYRKKLEIEEAAAESARKENTAPQTPDVETAAYEDEAKDA